MLHAFTIQERDNSRSPIADESGDRARMQLARLPRCPVLLTCHKNLRGMYNMKDRWRSQLGMLRNQFPRHPANRAAPIQLRHDCCAQLRMLGHPVLL